MIFVVETNRRRESCIWLNSVKPREDKSLLYGIQSSIKPGRLNPGIFVSVYTIDVCYFPLILSEMKYILIKEWGYLFLLIVSYKLDTQPP